MASDADFVTFVPLNAVPTVPAARTSYTVNVLPDAVAGLVSRRVTAAMPGFHQLVELYEDSFAAGKHRPLWQLRMLARRSCAELRAFYDADELCALACVVNTGRIVYLPYLAVEAQVRSRGYGSRVLTWVKTRYPRRTVVLGVEPVFQGAPDYDRRLACLAFCEHNGFRETGYAYVEGGETRPIVFSGWVFDPDAMYEALALTSFGLHRPALVLLDDEGAA